MRLTLWLVLSSLVVLSTGCDQTPAQSADVQLPTVGDPRSLVSQRLSEYKSSDGGEFYDVSIGGQDVRVGYLYSKDGSGVDRVMQVNVHAHDGIDPAALTAVKAILVPRDAQVLLERNTPATALQDARNLDPGESMGVLASASVASKIHEHRYYVIPGGGWRTGHCPLVSPGILESYSEDDPDDNSLVRWGLFSAYLDHCAAKEL